MKKNNTVKQSLKKDAKKSTTGAQESITPSQRDRSRRDATEREGDHGELMASEDACVAAVWRSEGRNLYS
jgi:hypothetical protein